MFTLNTHDFFQYQFHTKDFEQPLEKIVFKSIDNSMVSENKNQYSILKLDETHDVRSSKVMIPEQNSRDVVVILDTEATTFLMYHVVQLFQVNCG